MLPPQKHKRALKAIHQLLVQGRIFTHEDLPKDKMFTYFDELEYLVALLMEEGDTEEHFASHLRQTCTHFHIEYINDQYTQPQ